MFYYYLKNVINKCLTYAIKFQYLFRRRTDSDYIDYEALKMHLFEKTSSCLFKN